MTVVESTRRNIQSKAKLFERNLDVYINAPLIGFLYRRKGIKDTNGEISPQNIFPEQMINVSDRLKYILRLIVLLDSEYEPDEEKRIDKYIADHEKVFSRFGLNILNVPFWNQKKSI